MWLILVVFSGSFWFLRSVVYRDSLRNGGFEDRDMDAEKIFVSTKSELE